MPDQSRKGGGGNGSPDTELKDPYPVEVNLSWNPHTGQLRMNYPENVDPSVVLGVLSLADFQIKRRLSKGAQKSRGPRILRAPGPLPT